MRYVFCFVMGLVLLGCSAQEFQAEGDIDLSSKIPPILIGDNTGVVSPGSDATLTWQIDSEQPQTVYVEVSYDEGKTWHVVQVNVVNTGEYSYPVPDIPGATFRLRLVGPDGEKVVAQTDDVKIDGTTPEIVVSGGQSTIEAESTVNLSWPTNSDQSSEVTLQASTDGGSTFTTIQTGISNTGSFSYEVPEEMVGSLILRILDGKKNFVLAQHSGLTVIEKKPTGITGFTIVNGGGVVSGSSYLGVVTIGEPIESQLLSTAEGNILFRGGLFGTVE